MSNDSGDRHDSKTKGKSWAVTAPKMYFLGNVSLKLRKIKVSEILTPEYQRERNCAEESYCNI